MTVSLVAVLGVFATSIAPQQSTYLTPLQSAPASYTATPVTAACAGRLNGNSMIDVASLRDGQILIAYDPGLGQANGIVPGEYLDFDAAALSALDPEARTMFAVGPLGLQRLDWDATGHAFEPVDVFDPVAQQAGYDEWLGATLVRAGDLDGQGGPDLVGISANRRRILVALSDAAGFRRLAAGTFQPVLSGPAVDLCLADRNHDGICEIGVVTETSFEVFDLAGQRLRFEPRSEGALYVEPFALDGDQATGFAVLHAPKVGNASITLYSPATLQPVQVVGIWGSTPTGLRATTFLDSGGTELLVSHRQSRPTTLYVQQSGLLRRAAQDSAWPLRMGAPHLSGDAPVIADVDHDGDLDVLYQMAGVRKVHVVRNETVDHRSLAPNVLRHQNGSPHLWLAQVSPIAPMTQASVRYEYSPSGSFGTDAVLPPGATHLQLYLWSAAETGFGQFETDATPTVAVAYSIGRDAQYETWSDQHVGTRHYFEHQFPIFSAVSSDARLHFLTARYVRLGSDYKVLESWPHDTMHFARYGDHSAAAYIDGLPFAFGGTPLFGHDPHVQTTGGTEVGGGGGTGCVPDYPPGTPPKEIRPTPIP